MKKENKELNEKLKEEVKEKLNSEKVKEKKDKENQNNKSNQENINDKEDNIKNNNEVNNKKKNKKMRKKIVLFVMIIALLIIYIIERGEFLEIKEIGENYSSVFWQNLKYRGIIALVNFSLIFSLTYIATNKIKNSLKIFFEDEKKEMPKLPQKSIAFIFATISTIAVTGIAMEKLLPCIFNTKFIATDIALGFDIGFFVFIWPFLEFLTLYFLVTFGMLLLYSAIYYLIVFNIYFDGITRESVKKSKLLYQALRYFKILIVLFAILVVLKTLNIGIQKFIIINNDDLENYSLFGAGLTEITIRFWGYMGLSVVMIFSVFKAVKELKKGRNKKVIESIMIVPIYLTGLLFVMLGFNLVFINSNELDKEKKYIAENIRNTKIAFGIDIDEMLVKDEGTITQNSITNNIETIKNIPLVNPDIVLNDLEGSQKNKGYYKYRNTKLGMYNINGKNQLVYVTPREIVSPKGTYNNKTYEYTHGFGTIITSATETTENGNIKHIQKAFDQSDEVVKIEEPRIYFGLETNNIAVTNSNSKKEFDYPMQEGLKNTENVYSGDAGLKVNFIDRLILAIKEKDSKLVFSGNITSNSKILTNRNIIQRAKTIMPYLTYDEEPYMVIDNSGKLIWVLDAYTTSNEYPYSQRIILNNNKIAKKEINYIRNSVKVLIDAYSGDVTFYITDKLDPIVMSYNKMYEDLFSKEEIPSDIANHFVYPKYLYKIQSNILKRYHNVKPDVLYRSDDVWDIATFNKSSKVKTAKGKEIEPYYTMLKTSESTERFGLVLPYTPRDKQNISGYLVGSCDENGNNVLKLYNFPLDSNVIGPMQLDTQLVQDETISKEIEALNVFGTKITKDVFIVPIDNSLLYIEPIYQQYVNEVDSLPILKKVVVASGNKVSIGNNLDEALINLVSKYAVNIEIENTDSIEELAELIIKANNNLKASMQSNDWEQVGKDTKKLQSLVDRLEEVKKEIDKKAEEELKQQEEIEKDNNEEREEIKKEENKKTEDIKDNINENKKENTKQNIIQNQILEKVI